jgi:hypothetical protein
MVDLYAAAAKAERPTGLAAASKAASTKSRVITKKTAATWTYGLPGGDII